MRGYSGSGNCIVREINKKSGMNEESRNPFSGRMKWNARKKIRQGRANSLKNPEGTEDR